MLYTLTDVAPWALILWLGCVFSITPIPKWLRFLLELLLWGAAQLILQAHFDALKWDLRAPQEVMPTRSQAFWLKDQYKFNVGGDTVSEFAENGFFVVRQALPLHMVKDMHTLASRRCSQQMRLLGSCLIPESRRALSSVRDFLSYGPLGQLAHNIFEHWATISPLAAYIKDEHKYGGGVRVYHDAIFADWKDGPWGTSSRDKAYMNHISHDGQPGIFGGLHSNTPGLVAWVPLQDLDAESSLVLHPKFTSSHCPDLYGARSTLNMTVNLYQSMKECVPQKVQGLQQSLRLSRGDIVLFHPLMLHRLEPLRRNLRRYIWYAWLVNGNAKMCSQRRCSHGAGKACCPHPYREPSPDSADGQQLHTPCFPAIYPYHPQADSFSVLMSFKWVSNLKMPVTGFPKTKDDQRGDNFYCSLTQFTNHAGFAR